MRTRTSTSTRFNLKFLRVFSKKKKPLRKASFYFFHQKKLVWLFILKQVKPSPDSKMIKLLTFILITCCRHKTSRRMTTAITFCRQLTRAQYLVLRQSRARSRPRPRIYSSLFLRTHLRSIFAALNGRTREKTSGTSPGYYQACWATNLLSIITLPTICINYPAL